MCAIFLWIRSDQWMSFGDRERSDRALLAELWRVFPPQPNEPVLPAVHLRGLFCLIAKQQRGTFSRGH